MTCNVSLDVVLVSFDWLKVVQFRDTLQPNGFKEMANLGSALNFISAFPEAQSWSVTLLTEEKRFIVHKAHCPREELLKELKGWLAMRNIHFFIRPLMSNVVFLDLDNYRGPFEVLLRLKPRRRNLPFPFPLPFP